MSPSNRHHQTLIATVLTTRRGVFTLFLLIFFIYFLIQSTSSSPSSTTTTPTTSESAKGGGVRGWAKEYWNEGGSWWSKSSSTSEDRRLSPGTESLVREKGDLAPIGGSNRDEEMYGNGREEDEGIREKEYEEEGELRRIGRPFGNTGGHQPRPDGDSRFDSDGRQSREEEEEEESGYRGGGEGGGPSQFDRGDHKPLVSVEEEALADSPRIAIEQGAADRAPMAQLAAPPSSSSSNDDENSNDDSTTSTNELADHAAAKVPSKMNDKVDGTKSGPNVKRPKPVPGKLPKKIGTGGKVVRPDELIAAAQPVENEEGAVGGGGGGGHGSKAGLGGGGEKAGKIVQEEAGRRVGTGARPGAKGMGLEEVVGLTGERRMARRSRRRNNKRTVEW